MTFGTPATSAEDRTCLPNDSQPNIQLFFAALVRRRPSERSPVTGLWHHLPHRLFQSPPPTHLPPVSRRQSTIPLVPPGIPSILWHGTSTPDSRRKSVPLSTGHWPRRGVSARRPHSASHRSRRCCSRHGDSQDQSLPVTAADGFAVSFTPSVDDSLGSAGNSIKTLARHLWCAEKYGPTRLPVVRGPAAGRA